MEGSLLAITADWYEDDGSGNRVLWKMSLTNAVRTLICIYPDEDLLFEGEEKIKESLINLGNRETVVKRS